LAERGNIVNRGLLGLLVGLVGAIGAMWAARRFFGSGEEEAPGGGAAGTGSMDAAAPAGEPARREGLDPTLLEILACPDDKAPVIYQREGDAERLTCTRCGKRYPVRDGIPVMLIDEATPGPVPTDADVAAARALVSEGEPALVGAASPAPAAPPAPAPPPPTPPSQGPPAASPPSA
jgi:uncharacterized protein YbaR (Trm112 family)